MKITSSLLVLTLAAGMSLHAAETAEPAAAKASAAAAPKAEGADAAWEQIAPLLSGPKTRPKSKEEALDIYKKFLAEMDEKSAAFLKAYPSDARRWKLKMHDVQVNRMRAFAEVPAKPDEEIAKLIEEIIAAPDADKETKGFASFIRVMNKASDGAAFEKLAATHLKEFPEFRGNQQIEGQLKTIETEKSLKEKPLELSFKATSGEEIDVSKMRGKVILVDFWATWCGPCVAEIPNVVGTYKKLHDKGFEIIGISFDQDKDKLAAMTKEKEMPWAQYFDGEGWSNKFGKQFGITSIPRMWLINKKGMVVDTNGREDLEKKVEKLLAE